MDLRKMFAVYRAFRAGVPLGDVVVLKLDALAPSRARRRVKRDELRADVPAHDLAALRTLPASTLGGAYARFLDANRIVPLVVSPEVRARFRDDPYVLRYTATHDLHHVLTGFDTGLAGEIGVFAFTVGQGTAPAGRAMLWFARFVYALLSPTQARRIWHDARVGLAMGEAAATVLSAPLEASFAAPLAEVRRSLGIPDPAAAGVLPSGTSLVVRLFYPMPAMASGGAVRGHAG